MTSKSGAEQIRAYLSSIGKKGGSASSKKKTKAVRANASKPPKPGKRPRGRPKKEERK